MQIKTENNSWVYEKLRSSITSLQLKPGSFLNINDLSDEYKVSRSPLRDALLRLERHHLIEIFPQRGTIVSFIDEDTITQELYLRSSLEVRVLRQFMNLEKSENEQASIINKFRSNILLQEGALLTNDLTSFMQHYNNFHSIFFDECGFDRIKRIIQAHTGNFQRLVMLLSKVGDFPAQAVSEQKEILDAIISKDEEKVVSLMKAHIIRKDLSISELKQKFPSYFKQL